MTDQDHHYINQVLNGDKNAYAALVMRYRNMVFNLCLKMLKQREEAEEVAQDVFVKAFTRLGKFQGKSKFSTWLYKICYHNCLDHLKKKKRTLNIIDDVDIKRKELIELNNAFEQLMDKERSVAIKNCLNKLDSEDGFILSLYYYEEKTVTEISQIMDISTSNVKVKLFRARKRLATIFKSELEPEYLEGYEKAFKPAIR